VIAQVLEERVCATGGGPLSRWGELDQHEREHHPDCLHPPTSAKATCLGWALAYAQFGWRVHPCFWIRQDGACSCGEECNSPGKHPIFRAWQRQATTDQALITRWWSRTPNANIAVATGPESGIFVLDVDGPDGERTLVDLERRHGPMPETFCQQWTGSGVGWQAFFAYPEGRNIRNSAGRLGRKLDTRGINGYVLLPPSNHRSGNRYGWAVDRKPGNIPPDDAPPWLVDLLDPPEIPEPERAGSSSTQATSGASADQYIEKAFTTELKLTARAPEGERNNQLFASAVSLLRFVADGRLPLAAVTVDLREAARAAQLPELEIERTLKSAAARRSITI